MAQWIWYPGDFEFYLGLKVYSLRTERGLVITPNWRVENFYNNVKFIKEFVLEEDSVIKIHSTGTQCVTLDYAWYSHYEPEVGLPVSKGRHTIWIQVFNATELPSIYIDCPGVETGEGWVVNCDHICNRPVGYWNFTDPKKPPTTFKLETVEIEPTEIVKMDEGLLYDFGKETIGFLKGDSIMGRGNVNLYYGESKEEALDTEYCCIFETVNVKEDGSFYVPRSQAFRYIYIPHVEGITIGHLGADFEYLPIENKGAFTCEDPLLNQIYDVSVRTMHLTSREFFLDGIKRDRWVWSGDAVQSYLMNYYSFFDNDICKRTMRLIRGKDPIATPFNTIQDYTLYWFQGLWEYYMYTGDIQFVREMYPKACTLMDDFCLEQTDFRGFFIGKPTDWVFIDWANVPNMKDGDNSFIQLLFAYSLKAMADLAGTVEDVENQRRYESLYLDLLGKIFNTFWSEEKGCFCNGPANLPDAFVTRYANMFGIIYGCLSDEQKKSVVDAVLRNDSVYSITTPYMKFYELLAFCEAGLYEETEAYIKSYWGGMLDLGCTTFWEKYDPSNEGIKHYEMYGLKYGVSLCHAWGAGPILLYGKYYLGVRPTAPGYERFVVEPHLIGGKHISGEVPVPNGTIKVSLTEEKVLVENLSKGTGELHIDGLKIPILPGEHVELDRK